MEYLDDREEAGAWGRMENLAPSESRAWALGLGSLVPRALEMDVGCVSLISLISFPAMWL